MFRKFEKKILEKGFFLIVKNEFDWKNDYRESRYL